jgi:hypothetical protein
MLALACFKAPPLAPALHGPASSGLGFGAVQKL